MDVNREVLKGHIDTLILSLISRRDMYGYELAKMVREKTNNQFEIKEGTLYLSLKRMETNNFIESYWSEDQGAGGRRKYYKILASGKEELEKKLIEWRFIKIIIDSFLEGRENQ